MLMPAAWRAYGWMMFSCKTPAWQLCPRPPDTRASPPLSPGHHARSSHNWHCFITWSRGKGSEFFRRMKKNPNNPTPKSHYKKMGMSLIPPVPFSNKGTRGTKLGWRTGRSPRRWLFFFPNGVASEGAGEETPLRKDVTCKGSCRALFLPNSRNHGVHTRGRDYC